MQPVQTPRSTRRSIMPDRDRLPQLISDHRILLRRHDADPPTDMIQRHPDPMVPVAVGASWQREARHQAAVRLPGCQSIMRHNGRSAQSRASIGGFLRMVMAPWPRRERAVIAPALLPGPPQSATSSSALRAPTITTTWSAR